MAIEKIIELNLIDELTRDESIKNYRLDIFVYFYKLFTNKKDISKFTNPLMDEIFIRLGALGYTPFGTDFEFLRKLKFNIDCINTCDNDPINGKIYYLPIDENKEV